MNDEKHRATIKVRILLRM